MDDVIVIDPDLRRRGEPVGKLLFGHNLEITRSTMFGGLSAQLLNNRKFFHKNGKAPGGWTLSSACDAVAGGVRVALSGAAARISQCNPAMRAMFGRPHDFRLRLVLRGKADLAVSCGSAARAILHVSSDGSAPLSLKGRLTPRGGQGDAEFVIEATGSGEMTIACASVLPADAVVNGLRSDVIERLAALRPACLRFPGGCYAEFYDWKQGLLDADERPVISVEGMSFLLGPTFDQDPQDMNLDDFIVLCRMAGAEPQFTVRVSENTAQDAADVVAYANLDATNKWGAMRVARGFKEPFRIKRWYVGNELMPFGRGGVNNPETAAAKTVEFARAMKAVDPSIELIPSNWALSDWNKRFLSEIERLGGTKLIAMASYHQYLLDLLEGGPQVELKDVGAPGGFERLQACLRAPAELILPRMRAARAELDAQGGTFKGMPISMDEWNYYWDRPGHPVLALYAAGILNVLVNNASRLGIRQALYFHPVNEGLLRVTPGEVYEEDGAPIFRLYARHAGMRALELPALPPEHPLDVAASTDGQTLFVTVINRDIKESVSCLIPHAKGARRVQTECYAAEDIVRRCFEPASMRKVVLAPDREGVFALPPASVTGVAIAIEHS